MRITVKDFEDQEDKTLVFGVDESGRKVSFHISREVANTMRAQMAIGNEVQAEMPDGVPAGTAIRKIGERTEIRRNN